MGGGGGGTDWERVAYDNAYAAAKRGASLNSIIASQPQYAAASKAGFNAARPSGGGGGGHVPSFEMPNLNTGPSLEEQMRQQEKAQGRRDRDALYSNYMTAAQSATDFINAEIAQEQQNARLLGIDYAITDEVKSQRISDYFSTVWGEGDQTQLETLMDKWGKPKGFEGFTITRGTGGKYAGGGLQGGGEQVGTSKGIRPELPGQKEEEEGNVLGL